MHPLPPSCGPCHHHATPAAIMQPLPPSCGASATLNHWNPFSWPIIPLECSYPFPATPATMMRRLPPFFSPCHHQTVPATIMQPLPSLYGPCTNKLLLPAGRLLLFCSLGPSFPALSPWPSLGGGPVAAQNLPPSAVVDPRMSWGGNLPEACLYKPVPVLYVSLTSYTRINHHSLHISIK
jgi:hypothetical protein